MTKLFAPLLLTLAALFLGGCGSHTEVITAGLRTDLVSVKRAASGDIQITWRVRNPNVISYVLTKHAIKVSLDGVPVGTATGTSRFGIPSMNQVDQTSVLTVTDPAASQALAQALARGSASYKLDATLWLLIVDEDIEKFNLTGSGTVPVTAE